MSPPVPVEVVVGDAITQTPGPHRCCRQFPWEPGGGSGWGAALLPLSSSSSLSSSASLLPADVGYGEVRALVGKGLNVFISQ